MKHVLNIQSDTELINSYKINNCPEILEALLERNQNLLNKIAHNHTNKYSNTTFDDNRQNTILGAIIAIQSFNLDKETKLSTYLYKSVTMYLLTCQDNRLYRVLK